ncbi:MAG: YccF domain-containing protein [Salinivirgaceae bacterium]
MKTLGNIIWLVFGGIFIALEYLLASIPFFISIIGIPFGLQALKLGMLALWPFGAEIRIKPGNPGCLSTLMNFLWFFIGGIWICLTHFVFGLLFGITIVGIPFAIQHFKLVSLALTPFGREVISK